MNDGRGPGARERVVSSRFRGVCLVKRETEVDGRRRLSGGFSCQASQIAQPIVNFPAISPVKE